MDTLFLIEVDKKLAFFMTLWASWPTIDSFRILLISTPSSKFAITGAIILFANVLSVELIFDSFFVIFSTTFVNWNAEWPWPFLRTNLGWNTMNFVKILEKFSSEINAINHLFYLIFKKACKGDSKGFLHGLIIISINKRIQSTIDKYKVILDIQ